MKYLKKYKQFESIEHLSQRGIDPSRTHFVYDEATNNTYFFLYNLSGDCVGYQKYNPDITPEELYHLVKF